MTKTPLANADGVFLLNGGEQMSEPLDRLEIEITSNTKEATDGINKQISALQNLKATANNMSLPKTKIKVDSSDVDKATKKVSKLSEVLGSFKRIAMYRLVRSAIKAVTDAIKEGLESAYEYSKLTGGALARSLDKLASKSQKFKNQLGAAFGELIEGIEPFLSDVLDDLTELAKTITSLFAMVGQAIRVIYTALKPVIDFALEAAKEILSALRQIFDAIGQILGSDGYLVANDIEKSWKEADKAAKEYKRTLIGIDEINRLNDDNGKKDAEDILGSFFNNNDTPQGFDFNKPIAIPVDYGDLSAALETVKALEAELAPAYAFQLETEPAIIKLTQLETALQGVPAHMPQLVFAPVPSPVLESVYAWENALDGVKVSAKQAEEALNPLYSKFPVNLAFKVTSPIPALEAVADYLASTFIPLLLKKFPFIMTFKVQSPAPALQQALTDTGNVLESFKEKAVNAWARVVSAVQNFEREYEKAKENAAQIHAQWDKNFDEFLASAYEHFTGFAGDVKQTVSTVFKSISNFISNVIEKVSSAINQLKQTFNSNGGWQELLTGERATQRAKERGYYNPAMSAMTAINGAAFSGGLSLIPSLVGAFASGGYVDSGELFLARESGAELVGSIGGHTGVANNDQIIEGISEGVAYANVGVIAAINQLIAEVQKIDPTVELDGLTLNRGLHKYDRQVNTEAGSSLVMEVMA